MSIRVCPIATVQASVEQAWSMLAEPANYALWWDADTLSITPPGPARPGQRIQAQTFGLRRKWPLAITIEGLDPARHQIDLTTELPLGITVHNHLACVPVDSASCRISFG